MNNHHESSHAPPRDDAPDLGHDDAQLLANERLTALTKGWTGRPTSAILSTT
jgi:hypothetical protein